jgi:hypothetical protein
MTSTLTTHLIALLPLLLSPSSPVPPSSFNQTNSYFPPSPLPTQTSFSTPPPRSSSLQPLNRSVTVSRDGGNRWEHRKEAMVKCLRGLKSLGKVKEVEKLIREADEAIKWGGIRDELMNVSNFQPIPSSRCP